MSITVEATYVNGVFRPLQKVDIPENDRVRLVIERMEAARERPRRRIVIDPVIARAIGEGPEFSLWG